MITGLAIGLFVGVCIGYAVCALMVISKGASE